MAALKHRVRAILALLAMGFSGLAQAQAVNPGVRDWGLNLPTAATDRAEMVYSFHNGPLMGLAFGISIFVLILLIYVVVRYNRRANPTPSKFSHSTLLEVVWTGIPTLIVIVLVLISVPLIWNLNRDQTPFYTVELTALPTYNWQVQAIDMTPEALEEIARLSAEAQADADRLNDAERSALVGTAVQSAQNQVARLYSTYGGSQDEGLPVLTEPYFASLQDSSAGRVTATGETVAMDPLGDTDMRLVIPSGVPVRFLITAPADGLMHAFNQQNFAITLDAIPGHPQEVTFTVHEGMEGTYVAYCSEMCGQGHPFMPLAIDVVNLEQFLTYMSASLEAGFAYPSAAEVPGLLDLQAAAELNLNANDSFTLAADAN